jgi:hypothetical protein
VIYIKISAIQFMAAINAHKAKIIKAAYFSKTSAATSEG